jgi:hypothetical protein
MAIDPNTGLDLAQALGIPPNAGQGAAAPAGAPTGQPTRLSDILSIALPALAGVAAATRPSLGIGRGAAVALGSYDAIQNQMRMKQALADAKARDALGIQNFGRLADYYTGQPGTAPAGPGPVQVAGPPSAGAGDAKVKAFAESHGLPTDAVINPQYGQFLKAYYLSDKEKAVAALTSAVNQGKRLPYGLVPTPKAGEEIDTTTAEGLTVKRKGPSIDPAVHNAEETLLSLASTGVTSGPVVDAAKAILTQKNEKTPFAVINDLLSRGITTGPQIETAWKALKIQHPDQLPASSQLVFGKNGEALAFDPHSKTVTTIALPPGTSGIVPSAGATGADARRDALLRDLAVKQAQGLISLEEAKSAVDNFDQLSTHGQGSAAVPYKSPADVKAAVASGKISWDQGAQILRGQFGVK